MQSTRIAPLTAADQKIIQLPARLDAQAAEEMEGSVLIALKIGAHDLILDAGGTSYITAAGLRAFLVLAKDIKAAGGHLSVCNLQPQARELFDACGFAAFIPAYSHLGEAAVKMVA